MSETTQTDAGAPVTSDRGDAVPSGGRGSDEQLLDELIFKQDLNEVHMLIDFVSGRPDRSLSTLSFLDPENPAKTMTSGEVIKAVAEMRYPPKGTQAVNARNAAILLVAKDRLSALAAPVNGLTIAYTRLFIDAEAGGSWFDSRRWLRRGGQNRNPPHDIRVDLAQRSFPGLQAHARKFRLWRDGLAFFSLFWLLLTGLAYGDAGLGRAALERLDQDWKIIVGKLKDNPALIQCQDASVKPAETGAELNGDTIQKQFACREYNYLRVVGQTAGEQVGDVFRCKKMGLSRLVHVWCWHWLLSGSAVKPDMVERGDQTVPRTWADPTAPSSYAKANVAYWQTATLILSVFTGYILPIMFALLGTLIGAFRSILNRIRANELAPRDLVRMKLGIPTGLVAGIAVGLFLSPSSVPLQGEGGVAGQLTLTASGLGFLAGYASHRFFGFLDNVIRSVFPYGSTSNVAAMPTVSPPATETRA
jgi:hypothetical protein